MCHTETIGLSGAQTAWALDETLPAPAPATGRTCIPQGPYIYGERGTISNRNMFNRFMGVLIRFAALLWM